MIKKKPDRQIDHRIGNMQIVLDESGLFFFDSIVCFHIKGCPIALVSPAENELDILICYNLYIVYLDQ
jgi:hypothetical protein